ncbi:MAG: hypothetical protein WAU70_10455 [Flavobacteriales bacterium]
MSGTLLKRLGWLAVFAIAMAYLESAVVVYLRALFFPEGFTFPMPVMDRSIVITEVGRELATMIMLVAPAMLLARSSAERFAWFLFAFGVWDIFYYVWLKVLLGWPGSILAMDILFLVPVPWVGPVIAPCVVSLGFIALAVTILFGAHKQGSFSVVWYERVLLCMGAVTVLWSFMGDHIVHLTKHGGDMLSNGPAYMLKDTGLEAAFSWSAFLGGTVLASAALLSAARRAFR